MKIQGHEQGSAAAVIGMMDAATASGHYTAADAYPYLAGLTSLDALTVPAWAQDGGRPEMIKRFQNPEMRARIAKEIEDGLDARFGGAEGVYLPQTARKLVDIMRERKTPAGETIIQILEQGNVLGILHVAGILQFGREDDLVAILRDPVTAIACDCRASLETRTHPRAFGTFLRVLGHYVRETHALTWEDAVRKMTALPANTVGIVDRGFLMPGMVADVTVFDPNTVIDHATYENPALVSEGIRHVLVNGKLALRDGKVTGERAGRTLLRSAHMPTRPMSVNSSRRVFVVASGITINITQAAGAARAKGPSSWWTRRLKLRFNPPPWGSSKPLGNGRHSPPAPSHSPATPSARSPWSSISTAPSRASRWISKTPSTSLRPRCQDGLKLPVPRRSEDVSGSLTGPRTGTPGPGRHAMQPRGVQHFHRRLIQHNRARGSSGKGTGH
jgi:hypothetical protein